jgi:hypothetical protein
MGEWPELITDQTFQILETTKRENFTQHKVRFRWLPNEETEGYLLIPNGEGKKPAVITVFYEPETAIGLGKPHRDFAYQLTKRGFVTLSIGTKKPPKQKPIRSIIRPLKMQKFNLCRCWHTLPPTPGMCWLKWKKWIPPGLELPGIRLAGNGLCLPPACLKSLPVPFGPTRELFSTKPKARQ